MNSNLKVNPSDNVKVSAMARLLKSVISWPGKANSDKFAPVPLMYWFPGTEIPEDFKLRFARVKNTMRAVGPTKKNGMLASPFHGILENKSELYDWKQSGGQWIAVTKNHSPQLFLKPSKLGDIAGYPVMMGDGNLWHIPVANKKMPTCTIPFTEEIDENGQWVKRTLDDYALLCLVTDELLEQAAGNGEIERSDDELRTASCLAIGANYDLSPIEIARLGLLNTDSYHLIFEALIDIPNIRKIASME